MHPTPDAKVDQRDIRLYQRAQILKAFPAYKFADLDTLPLIEIMQAMQLLSVARDALG